MADWISDFSNNTNTRFVEKDEIEENRVYNILKFNKVNFSNFSVIFLTLDDCILVICEIGQLPDLRQIKNYQVKRVGDHLQWKKVNKKKIDTSKNRRLIIDDTEDD